MIYFCLCIQVNVGCVPKKVCSQIFMLSFYHKYVVVHVMFVPLCAEVVSEFT